MQKSKVRLSKNVLPEKYSLIIKPDLQSFTFVGEETINLVLNSSQPTLTLHSKDLEITDGWYQIGKDKFDVKDIKYNIKNESATLKFSKKLGQGKGKLTLHFRGVIADNLRGFYRSQYTQNGKTKHMATTQFEATDARRAFPCFDEPSHKAVFELSVKIPNHLTAISNTVEVATPKGVEHDPGYKVVKFAPTPKMSTYLLAYIIGEFESIETKTKNGVLIRVFTTKGKKHQAKFSLEVAKRSLEFLNEYFAIPYPLPVLDLIAIPDFSSGAMENWGAVTFRESALLVDEQHTAFANKQYVAEVVAHELVHQWFGNLVTMEWWTHLWLNESFASFMSYVVVDELFPEWKFWTRFVMHDHANALQLDSLQNTHPIEVEVHNPNQISEIFDAISYDKGASVLRMLQHYIGPDNFRDGLRYYLKKHSYKNTSSIHLWEAFEKVSGKPISKFMKQWVSKPGYPVVSIAEPKPGKLAVKQNRFTLKNKKDKTLWPIPLQFELGEGKLSNLETLSSQSKKFSISLDAKYIKANPEETGFYRAIYSPGLLAKLYEPVNEKELSVVDRFGIIRDLFAMAKSGELPTSAYLEFLKAYEEEDSYIVWSEILSGMGEIYQLFSNDKKSQVKISKYYLKILKKVVSKVGWESDHKESQARALLRGIVLNAYGSYGDSATIKKAKQLYLNKAKSKISPDIRSTVYGLFAINSKTADWSNLISHFEGEGLQEEQRRIARALFKIRNEKLYLKSLKYSLSKQVRHQDAALWIAMAMSNSENKHLGWKWLQNNWKEIHSRYHDDHLVVWIVKSLGGFADVKIANQIKAFFKKNPTPGATRAIKQTLEQIALNTAWLKRDHKEILRCIDLA